MSKPVAWIGIDSDVWHTFQPACEAQGLTPRTVLRRLLLLQLRIWEETKADPEAHDHPPVHARNEEHA